MTVAERIATVAAVQGVIEAWQKAPVSLGETLTSVTVNWIYGSGDTVRKDSRDLIVSDFGGKNEEARWLERPPGVLVAPDEPEHGPLGDDEALIALLPVKVVKPEIERGANEARVSGYEILDGKAIPVLFLLYTDGVEVKVVRGDETKAGLEAAN